MDSVMALNDSGRNRQSCSWSKAQKPAPAAQRSFHTWLALRKILHT